MKNGERIHSNTLKLDGELKDTNVVKILDFKA
jgi:hypothetical protein